MQMPLIAQSVPGVTADASTIFYFTLLFIFVTAILTAVITKWARDKCLKTFHTYHVTVERTRGQTIWGRLKVFPNGLEIVYDYPFVDFRGRKKTSALMYQQDIDAQLLCVLRYHDELDERSRAARLKQVERTFNPNAMRRLWRGVRNFVNTLRDAFSAAIGAVVGQYQRMNPTSALMASQGQQVTQIGQTLLGRLANAFEPMLEQYMGQPVILDVADPINPNNQTTEYVGYLADYTQQYIALFNVNHLTEEWIELQLPDVEKGATLPPLPPPPPAGAPAPVLSEPVSSAHELAVRVDGYRFKILNLRHEPVAVRRLERPGFEPLEIGMTLPPRGTLDLPARDARNGKLICEIVRCCDVIAPRRLATVRHAGEQVERRSLVDDLGIDQLPLVPKFLNTIQDRTARVANIFSARDEAKESNREGPVT